MAYKDIERQRNASRQHYLTNKQQYLERNRQYRQSIQTFVRDLKEKSPCVDCNVYYPYYVMDFDHVDGAKKLNDINYLASSGRIGALKREIVKCEVVCANCHRARTHQRSLSSVD